MVKHEWWKWRMGYPGIWAQSGWYGIPTGDEQLKAIGLSKTEILKYEHKAWNKLPKRVQQKLIRSRLKRSKEKL